MVCAACSQAGELLDGILSIEPPHDDIPERKLQDAEEAVRDRQAKFYDAALRINIWSRIEKRRFERILDALAAESALDLGCGTGRMTLPLASRAKRVVAVDRSLESLRACHAKLVEAGLGDRVLLVRADLSQTPIRAGAFDLAISAQVLEHLPSQQLREQAVAVMGKAVRPGGSLVISVYEWQPWSGLWNRKEGFHRGGIPFFRFTRAELREVLEPTFRLTRVRSCLMRLLLAEGTKPA